MNDDRSMRAVKGSLGHSFIESNREIENWKVLARASDAGGRARESPGLPMDDCKTGPSSQTKSPVTSLSMRDVLS